MVRSVRTERQTSNCDVKCPIAFSFQGMFHVYGPLFGWKTSSIFLLKHCKMAYLVFIYLGLIFFFATTVSRHEPQSTMGDSHQCLLTTMQFTRISNAHVLSLELAALALKMSIMFMDISYRLIKLPKLMHKKMLGFCCFWGVFFKYAKHRPTARGARCLVVTVVTENHVTMSTARVFMDVMKVFRAVIVR